MARPALRSRQELIVAQQGKGEEGEKGRGADSSGERAASSGAADDDRARPSWQPDGAAVKTVLKLGRWAWGAAERELQEHLEALGDTADEAAGAILDAVSADKRRLLAGLFPYIAPFLGKRLAEAVRTGRIVIPAEELSETLDKTIEGGELRNIDLRLRDGAATVTGSFLRFPIAFDFSGDLEVAGWTVTADEAWVVLAPVGRVNRTTRVPLGAAAMAVAGTLFPESTGGPGIWALLAEQIPWLRTEGRNIVVDLLEHPRASSVLCRKVAGVSFHDFLRVAAIGIDDGGLVIELNFGRPGGRPFDDDGGLIDDDDVVDAGDTDRRARPGDPGPEAAGSPPARRRGGAAASGQPMAGPGSQADEADLQEAIHDLEEIGGSADDQDPDPADDATPAGKREA